MANGALSNLGRTLAFFGTGGISEGLRAGSIARQQQEREAQLKQQKIQQLGQVLGQEGITPQEQISQLAAIGTPEALQFARDTLSRQATPIQQAQLGIQQERLNLAKEESGLKRQQLNQQIKQSQAKEARAQRELDIRQNYLNVLQSGVGAPTASNEPVEVDVTDDSDIKSRIQELQARKQQFSGALTDPVLKEAAKSQIKDANDQIKKLQGLAKEKDFSTRSLLAQGLEVENISSLIDKVKDQAGVTTTGLGSVLGRIPGTGAADLAANLNTLQAHAGFGRLQQMRDNSPTGGALGQVSERELALLTSSVSSLEQSQSPEQFKENLDRFETRVKESWNNVLDAYKQDFGTLPKGAPSKFKTEEANVIDFSELPVR